MGKISKISNTVEQNLKFPLQLVDYLTAEFLEEQYKGQRELAEKIKTLEHMWQETPELSEFLFDKTLL
jgi:ferritin heavy chain